ncbi:Leucyl/phenylalanyl-tRNA-protein transferase, partial [mine drainage metagenome]
MSWPADSPPSFLSFLSPDDPDLRFPGTSHALANPPGLLAIGGDLRPERLLQAYRSGIFPWYETPGPILWWSPEPRFVWLRDGLRRPKRLTRTIRQEQGRFTLTIDQDFKNVLMQCGPERRESSGTWITAEMAQAYLDLYHLGYAHSVEMNDKSNT